MIYLSGAIRPELYSVPDTGFILTPMMGNRPDLTRIWWGADTGCFNQPDKYDDLAYIRWLSSHAAARKTCLFATAPDVVGDAVATWERSRVMLPIIRALGFPAALVAQDGIAEPEWDDFDVLFVGGTTEWKLSQTTHDLVAEAKRRGKWVHCGRVNSEKRLRLARDVGYDSADGTYLTFGPDVNLPKLKGWMTRLALQPPLI